jgi:hypothetical protein
MRRPAWRWLVGALAAAGLVASGRAAAVAAPAGPAATAGVTWSTQSVSVPGGGAFTAISCPTATFCMAVGTTVASSGATRPLVETWNGATWKVRHATTPAGTTRTQLSGVSCPTSANCTVVGATGSGATAGTPLAEVWNGKTEKWRVETTVRPTSDDLLEGVSCPTVSTCVAVGSEEATDGAAIHELWHSGGKGWSLMAAPAPGSSDGLTFVSCPTATRCVAVGEEVPPTSSTGTGSVSLLETWTGGQWEVTRTGTSRPAAATSVSCAGSESCGLVGTKGTTSRSGFALTFRSDRWRVAAFPSGQDPAAVGCSTVTECVAVGADAAGTKPAASLYAGGRWQAVTAPALPEGETSALGAISCPTAQRCVAIGGTFTGSSVRSYAGVATIKS